MNYFIINLLVNGRLNSARIISLLLITMLISFTAPAYGAIQIFLVSDEIKGESKDPVFPNSIEVTSFDLGISRSLEGVGGGGALDPAAFTDFGMIKKVDAASIDLMFAAATGETYGEMTFIMRRTGEKPLEYYAIRLENVHISSYSVGGAADSGEPTEEVLLDYGKISIFYRPQDQDGKPGDIKGDCWDLQTNSKCGG